MIFGHYPAKPRAIDAMWTVLAAATDLRDNDMVTICQRAIDAKMRGDRPLQRDLDSINAYFR